MEPETQSSFSNAGMKDLSLYPTDEQKKSQSVEGTTQGPPKPHSTTNGINGVNGINSHSYELNGTIPADAAPADISPPDVVDSVMSSEPAESHAADPAVQQPTSSIRTETEPTELSQQQGHSTTEAPPTNGLSASTLEPTHTSSPSVAPGDIMDTSTDVAGVEVSNLDLPHHPAVPAVDGTLPEAPIDPAPTPNTTQDSTQSSVRDRSLAPPASRATPSQDQDHVMADVPPSPSKLTRGREDEGEEDEPATKRSKIGGDGSQTPEFKMPDVPESTSTAQPLTVDTSVPALTASTQTSGPPPREHNPDYEKPLTKPQQKALLKGIGNMKRSAYAIPFNNPVDIEALKIPTYPTIVKQPMDLKTIEEKLKAGTYSTPAEVIADFDLIVSNCILFNGLEHGVSKQAVQLRGSFDKQLSNVPSHDFVEPTAGEKRAKKAAAPRAPPQRRESRGAATAAPVAASPTAASPSQAFALNPQGIPTIRRDSNITDGRPRREIHPPAPKDLPYSTQKPKRKKFAWDLKFCVNVYEELIKSKYGAFNWPFMQPVDPVALNIPTYHKMIKKPMDLSTVKEKLDNGSYGEPKEFESDVRLMFNNCYKFNPPDHTVHIAGKQLEAVFDEKWATKRQWIRDHAPASEPQSPEFSEQEDEDDDDEEEEDEGANDQISLLKKQIAAMSKQVELIEKKEKSSPPATSKKGKGGKAGKKDGKKDSKKDKKDTKSGKKKSTPYVNYEQKQEISTRINTLPEAKMSTALNIIRDNMPNLKGVQEDEIELDIDELSNEVLYKLLTFVRKYSTAPIPEPEPARVSAAPAASSRPKKNKPMGKEEQEKKIADLKAKLGYENAATVESPENYGADQNDDDTSGDDDSEESEED